MFAAALNVVAGGEGEEPPHGTEDDFLELINQQLQTVDISGASDDVQLHDDVRAALIGIVLEKSEMELLTRRRKEIPITADEDSLLSMPLGYLLPSTSNARVECMDKESQLLEAETECLTSRLKHMKSATKKMSTTRTQLRSAIKETDAKSSQCIERFDEMEIKMAIALSGCLSSSYQLMDVFPKPGVDLCSVSPQRTTTDGPFENYRRILDGISSLRKPVINRYERSVDDIHTIEKEIPTPEEIAADLPVLQELSTEGWRASVRSAEETAFDEEIEAIVDALSQDDRVDLSEFLSEDDTTTAEYSPEREFVDVEAELAAALKLDQINILRNKKFALDDAIRSFKEHILPPLQAMHDCLSSMHAKTVEAEALLGALGEEIEAVDDSVRAATPPKGTTAEGDASDDSLMFARLCDFFKSREASRPKGAPPLVMLDAEDIKNEINLWTAYEATLLEEEERLLARVSPSLENLSANHAPLLSATYQHSPLNSSPPFSDSPHLAEVKRSTQAKVGALAETLAKIQKVRPQQINCLNSNADGGCHSRILS
ncbi:hypothetical protein BDN71DRAFT_1449324 [Pleurotus eryngii]|uniref:Uncharacterized protein n=1 Tax=Pleurotus eryngii TaxID=5323 RepID=A0A9P6D7J7_PLEER|nr:hypothetical protein BDN71DRAFT_1449324 [Pleurotus eryngii]